MKHEQALTWFIHMVENGTLNPLNPDMGLIPDDILNQMLGEDGAAEEIEPTQAVINVAQFMLIACKTAIQKKKGYKTPRPFVVKAKEAFMAQERFLLLVTLESLKRAGLVDYQSIGSWHEKKAEVAISHKCPHPLNAALPPVGKKSFYVH